MDMLASYAPAPAEKRLRELTTNSSVSGNSNTTDTSMKTKQGNAL